MDRKEPKYGDDYPFHVIAPAFLLSELTTAKTPDVAHFHNELGRKLVLKSCFDSDGIRCLESWVDDRVEGLTILESEWGTAIHEWLVGSLGRARNGNRGECVVRPESRISFQRIHWIAWNAIGSGVLLLEEI